jgi:hypothetical protein
VVDGVICDYNKLHELNANDILSISILKSSGCLPVCRSFEANGVIVIATKASQNSTFAIKYLITRQPIPNATILLASKMDSNKRQILVSNDSGIVNIKRKADPDNYDLIVSTIGYKNFSATFGPLHRYNKSEILLKRDYKNSQEIIVSSTLGGCRHCGLYRVTSKANSISNKLPINNIHFNLYPNPIRSNSTLTIGWKQKEFGDHLLQLFNQSGQLILSKDIYINEKAKQFTINMPSVISGNYFLKLTSKTTGKSYTEKLIVE